MKHDTIVYQNGTRKFFSKIERFINAAMRFISKMEDQNIIPITVVPVMEINKPFSNRKLHPFIFSRGKFRHRFKLGFTVRESIGIALVNTKAIKKLTMTK